MAKSLVIVESPAKAKTINKYLGRDFVVKSSVGHIRDLPGVRLEQEDRPRAARAKAAADDAKAPAGKKREPPTRRRRQRAALIARMGIDPDERLGGAPTRSCPARRRSSPSCVGSPRIRRRGLPRDRSRSRGRGHRLAPARGDRRQEDSASSASSSTRSPRPPSRPPSRIPATSIMSRVNAQQARRFLDRVVGYMLSPLLWAKVARGLSAGRVQSVAVRLVVEREREIRAFIPRSSGRSTPSSTRERRSRRSGFQVAQGGRKRVPTRTSQAEERRRRRAARGGARLRDRPSANDKPTRTRPTAPYITSTLQQAASTRLGFSVKKTMVLAQRLYEAGHITYMRTDSTNLSGRGRRSLPGAHPASSYGDRYLPEEALSYSSKEGAQEAHEAIRPSDVHRAASKMSGLERDQQRLYEMIWRQFVACQMPPAEYLSTSIVVEARGLRAARARPHPRSSTASHQGAASHGQEARTNVRCPTCRSASGWLRWSSIRCSTSPSRRRASARRVW